MGFRHKQDPYQWKQWVHRGRHWHDNPKRGYPFRCDSAHMEDIRPDLRTVYNGL